jgi:hypothetical protein
MPTKKSTKKVKKSSSLVHHEPNIKAILSFFVLLVAFGVFLLFNNNKDILLGSTSLQFFLVLAVVLSGLLVALLFLINPHRKK